MELRYLQYPTVSSIPRKGLFTDKPLSNLPINKKKKKCQHFSRIKFLDFRARPSGIIKIKSQAQDASPSGLGAKDGNLVFVAGATGRVGSRTVRELIKLGLRVRAGVRSVKRAEPLAKSVKNMKAEDVAGGTQPIDKLELVECDLEKPDQIAPALGNSSVVICCIGASEKEIFDVSGPYRIDYQATKNLIDAATSAKVDHFILVTSLGTNKVGFPAAILNLFWGVLVWKRKAEEALLQSSLPYTIVRPGGMERPIDSFKETHNITLSEEDTLFGGQVSTLQVAELMAFMAKSRSLSYCKVVEVIAETTAPLTPMRELLKKIPSQRKEPIPKEVENASGSQPVQESTYAERVSEQKKSTLATSSSPYIAYEDLKPPTYPTPTLSTTRGATKDKNTEITPAAISSISSSSETNSSETSSIVTLEKPTPLSPYINYEDLKPPSSLSPTASGSKKESSIVQPCAEIASPLNGGNGDAKSGFASDFLKVPTESLASGQSPYLAYDDLKPPSSPSPSVPRVTVNIKTAEKEEISSYKTESKGQPLSPYTMYEDLKPPSSPMPSPRKLL